MARNDDISSTEKLLDVIRGDKTTADKTPGVSDNTLSTKEAKSISKKIKPFQKSITVGVDIGYHDLRLAKVKQVSHKEWKLLGFMKAPLEPQIPKESPEFPDFLKSTLTKFCGSSKKIKLWTLMPAAQVEIYHFRIPKVAKKQIANTVYWTLKKETSFSENGTIFDFEVQGNVIEKGIHKTAVVVCTVSKEEVEKIQTLFSKSGFPLTGLTIAPFANQNLLRTKWISPVEETIAGLYIGRDSSRIDIFHQGNLGLARAIKTGINSMIESLMEGINKSKEGISIEIKMPEREDTSTPDSSKEDLHMNIDEARKVLLSLSPDSPPLTETDPGFHLKEEQIFEMIQPAIERLTRQIERTFQHYSETLGNERVEKIIFSGGLNDYRPLINYIGDQLGIDNDIVDPLDPGNPFLNDILPPDSVSERLSFALAVGLALSDNSHTPNLIFIYKDKEKLAGISRINRGTLVAFIFIMAICSGIFLWQGHTAELKKAKIDQLHKELLQYSPEVDQNLIMLMADKVKRKHKDLKEYSKKYLAMAVISDLAMRTPSNIRLRSITADFGSITEDKTTKEKTKGTPKALVVDGIILGDRGMLESSLAGYIIKLESSPIFSKLSIIKSNLEHNEEREALHFILNIQMV